jgi:hypothetical protein
VSARLLALGLGLLLACGKYGPPVRAAAAKPEKPAAKPSFVVPLPSVPEPAPAPAAPETPAPPAPPEQEPPPEGSP